MKPIPPPQIEGKTDSERFNNALRKVLHHPASKSAASAKQQPLSNNQSAQPKRSK